MNRTRRLAAAVLGIAALAAAAAPARAQDAPMPPAPAPAPGDKPATGKEAKVRRFLSNLRMKETLMEQMDVAFDAQAATGMLPKGFVKKFREVADFDGLEKVFAGVWGDLLDEPTLDALNGFLETEAGKKYVEASMKVTRPMMEKIQPWAMENAMKAMQALTDSGEDEDEDEEGMEDEGDDAEEDGGAMAGLEKAKRSANEVAAVATLRNMASCQAQMQTSGKIDSDEDGIGEYGTLLELTGSVGVRKGYERTAEDGALRWGASDFSKQGFPVTPPIMSPSLAAVDADGVVVKAGYRFRIFLPDTKEKHAGFVHETGPKDKVGLAGGTGKVCVDLAETTWCAYAWPDKLGDSGTRVFFVDQSGDVMQSANEKTKWEGAKAPPANAIFRGAGITSMVAIGTTGADGEVWKLAR